MKPLQAIATAVDICLNDAQAPKAKKSKKSNKTKGNGHVYRMGDVATPERQLRNGGVVRDVEPETPNSRVLVVRHRARIECQLDLYLLRGVIDKAEFDAGMKFRKAWLNRVRGIAVRDPFMPPSQSFLNAVESACYSEQVITQAFIALTSIPQKMEVMSVCGEDKPRGEMRTLRRGLETLARFWKLI